MRTIAVVARKGGAGKTTLTVNLAIAAQLAGFDTLVADTDPQKSAIDVLQHRGPGGPAFVEATPATLLKVQIEAERAGVEALIIDTPAGTEEGMSNAIVLADLALLIVRPTYLDLAAAAYTSDILRKLRKPTLVVLNQAPVPRDGVEPPLVRKALKALELMRLSVVPAILRARVNFQTSVEGGLSAIETAPVSAAAQEVAAIWSYVEQFAFAPAEPLSHGGRTDTQLGR